MPRRIDLADWQRTVIRPVQKQFQPFGKNILVPVLAFPAPPTTSATGLLSGFQQSEETFQPISQFPLAQLQQFYDLLEYR